MSRGDISTSWAASVCLGVAVVVASLVLPTVASARWLRADDSAARAYMQRPKSVSKSTFSVRDICDFGDEDNPTTAVITFTGSKTKTVFQCGYLTGSGVRVRHVGYAKFAAYLKKYGTSASDVKYVWKTNRKGQKYRFAQFIKVAYYAE